MFACKVLTEYNLHRDRKASGSLCHTPFSTITLAQNGDPTSCCDNRDDIFGSYPDEPLTALSFEKKEQHRIEITQKDALPPGGNFLKGYEPAETTPWSIANNRTCPAMVEQVTEGIRLNYVRPLIFTILQPSMAATLIDRHDLGNQFSLESILTGYVIQTTYDKCRYNPTSLTPGSAYWSDRRLAAPNEQIASSLKCYSLLLAQLISQFFLLPLLRTFVRRLPQDGTFIDTDRIARNLDQFEKSHTALPNPTTLMGDTISAYIMCILQESSDLSPKRPLSADASCYDGIGQP